METNDEDDGIEQLLLNKDNGFSRSNPQNEAHKTSHQNTSAVNCSMCEKVFKNNHNMKEHMRIVHDEMICHMQCEGGKCSRAEAQGHVENMHNCNFCDEGFQSKNALSVHKSDVHRTYKPCRDIVNCVYQIGCYFSHVPVTLGKVRCYQCGEEFNTTNTMMVHRKIHGAVQECEQSVINQCNRGNNCWWNHEKNEKVFQQVKENLPPPIQQRQLLKQQTSSMETQMKEQMLVENNPIQELVDMVKVMSLELMKIKDVLKIN